MAAKPVYHPFAANDFGDAVNWYMNQSVRVAESFIQEVDQAIKLICNNPNRWSNKYADYRELKLKNFPFTVVYTFEEGQAFVVITAIHHHKKDPETKYR